MTFTDVLAGIKCWVLLDSGANCAFMFSAFKFAKVHKFCIDGCDHQIELAHGQPLAVKSIVQAHSLRTSVWRSWM